jgi:hypothetical protein
MARPPNSRNPAARRRSRPTAASATPVPSGNAGPSAAASAAAAPASSSVGVVATSSAAGSGSGSGSIPAASGHPPHVSPYASAIAVRNWSGPVHEQLEGPGMPVARSVAAHAVALAHPGVDGGASGGSGAGAIGPGGAGGGSGTPMDVVDGADDGAEADDGRVYCWCQMGSFGDMVACDDTECEREWVSLVSSCLWDLLGSLTLEHSSTWGVSDSRWPQRACGFVMRVGIKRRIGVRSRERPRRAGAAAVRTGTLVRRHVRPPRLDQVWSLRSKTLHPSYLLRPIYNVYFLASQCCSGIISKKSKGGTYNIIHR